MCQNVARHDSLRGRTATSMKVLNKRKNSQLKVGVQLACNAGKENVKFITWGTMKLMSGAMWLSGKTAVLVGTVTRIVGRGLVNGADGLTNLSTWLFG